MATLVLGPLLRYVGTTQATVWVETDAPCEVAVLGARRETFCVEGHHYALVHVEDLDAHLAQARAAGAEILRGPDDQPFGRLYTAADPEGHRWMFVEPA